jgi:hypothetical protein
MSSQQDHLSGRREREQGPHTPGGSWDLASHERPEHAYRPRREAFQAGVIVGAVLMIVALALILGVAAVLGAR